MMEIRTDVKTDSPQEAIRALFAEWEKLPRIPSHWQIVAVMDEERDRYALFDINFENGGHKASLMVYLEIRDGKIWIINNNMEQSIADGLTAAGIPNNRIVLAMHPPDLREMGDYAVA